MLTMEITALLKELSEASYITHRGAAEDLALQKIRRFSPDACLDPLGSIVAPIFPAVQNKEHLLLDAHLDEIGFVVTAVDEDGFLRVGKVGGPDLRILLGHEVTVFGKEPLFGVFCCRPPHLSTREDYKKSPEPDGLAIDIGYTHDQALDHVSPGDFVTLRMRPSELQNGRITGKALDNRAGVACLLRVLELLNGQTPKTGLTVLLSTSEECGERGATAGAFGIDATQAIVVDVSHGYTPDAPREKCGELGKGPMIGISPVLSRGVTNALFSIAAEDGIPTQSEIMGGSTGTNSDVVSVSRAGIQTGLVSIPLCYMHTAVEVIAAQDIEYTAQLIARYIMKAGRRPENA